MVKNSSYYNCYKVLWKWGTNVCGWQELWFLQINSDTTDVNSERYIRVTIMLVLMYWNFNS